MIDTGNKGCDPCRVLGKHRHPSNLVYRLVGWLAVLALPCSLLANIEALQTWSPLYSAAHTGERVRVAELLEYPNVRSEINEGLWSGFGMLGWSTPLIAAAEEGHTEIVKELLKVGANPNTRWTVGLGVLASGTPLFAAASKNHTATVAVLLEAGANPNNPNYGMFFSTTPLFTAASQPLGHTEVVKALLEAGANPNTMGYSTGDLFFMGDIFFTPLEIAEAQANAQVQSHAETVEALIRAGATRRPGFWRCVAFVVLFMVVWISSRDLVDWISSVIFEEDPKYRCKLNDGTSIYTKRRIFIMRDLGFHLLFYWAFGGIMRFARGSTCWMNENPYLNFIAFIAFIAFLAYFFAFCHPDAPC